VHAHWIGGAVTVAVSAMVVSSAGAQDPVSPAADSAAQAADTTPIYRLRADFTVPEGPAFKLVEIDESAILRPTSVRELAMSVADFTGGDGSFSLPSAIGLEAAPWLLARSRDLTRRQYHDAQPLYRFRVSIAAKLAEDTRQPTAIAVGIRETFIDHGDVRLDRVLEARIVENLLKQHQIHTRAATRVNPFGGGVESGSEVALSAEEQAEVDLLDRELARIIEQRQEETWNETRLEAALAFSGQSADESEGGLRSHAGRAWIAYGHRLGAHAQWLLGGRLSSARDTAGDFRTAAAASTRLYVGTQDYKGFVEAQAGYEEDQQYAPWFFNSGGEARVSNSVWAQLSAGVEQTAQIRRGRLTTRFSLRTALPRAR
jgi:hypothetical protein